MITFPKSRRIFLRPGFTDLRKSVNGLSLMAQEDMKKQIAGGDYFVFCNRRRSLLKILYYETNGFCLWYKRLDEQQFPWPEDEMAVCELKHREIAWLLKGIDFFAEHKKLNYKII